MLPTRPRLIYDTVEDPEGRFPAARYWGWSSIGVPVSRSDRWSAGSADRFGSRSIAAALKLATVEPWLGPLKAALGRVLDRYPDPTADRPEAVRVAPALL